MLQNKDSLLIAGRNIIYSDFQYRASNDWIIHKWELLYIIVDLLDDCCVSFDTANLPCHSF